MTRASLTALFGLTGLMGCAPAVRPQGDPGVLGRFEDDYGIQYEISDTAWFQAPGARYHIVRWNVTEQYLIARNDSANPADGGLWTRIDWMRLKGMSPWDWGFCLSTWNAPTASAAESTRVANRATPRTGCNGFPFSRMKAAAGPPTGIPYGTRDPEKR